MARYMMMFAAGSLAVLLGAPGHCQGLRKKTSFSTQEAPAEMASPSPSTQAQKFSGLASGVVDFGRRTEERLLALAEDPVAAAHLGTDLGFDLSILMYSFATEAAKNNGNEAAINNARAQYRKAMNNARAQYHKSINLQADTIRKVYKIDTTALRGQIDSLFNSMDKTLDLIGKTPSASSQKK